MTSTQDSMRNRFLQIFYYAKARAQLFSSTLITDVYSYFAEAIAKVVPFPINNARYFDVLTTSLSRDHVSKSRDFTIIFFYIPQRNTSGNVIDFC